MILPKSSKQLKLDSQVDRGPFLTYGTVRVDNYNEDYGGRNLLYWPLGNEDQEPFVCWLDDGKVELQHMEIAGLLAETSSIEHSRESYYRYLNQAKLYYRKNDFEAALSSAMKCREIFSSEKSVHKILINIFLKIGRIEDACSSAEDLEDCFDQLSIDRSCLEII